MKILFLCSFLMGGILLLISCTSQTTNQKPKNFEKIQVIYPETRMDAVKDDYHGTTIPDPYRWLEDDHAEDTKEWVSRQQSVTTDYLSQIPYRKLVNKRLREIWNYERYGSPFKRGGKYYYFKNDGLQDQSVLYVQDTLEGSASVVIDPNKFSDNGTVSLAGVYFNKTGNLLAYMTSEGGSDWRKIQVKDLRSGKMLEDEVHWVKFSDVSWKGDGFYYSRFPEPDQEDKLSGQNNFHKVYYHKLGTPQEADELIMEDRDHPQRNFYSGTSEDERFLFISMAESTSGNALFVQDLHQPNGKLIQLVSGFDYDFNVIDNVDDQIYIMTNYQAPNWRMIAVDITQPNANNWRNILPEQKEVLSTAHLVGDKLIGIYLVDAKDEARVFSQTGKFIQHLDLPGLGNVYGFSGQKGDDQAFFSFTSFIHPATIFSLDMQNLKPQVFKQPKVDFEGNQYITEQVFYTSYDGTKIPMFLTYKRGIKKDGQNPVLLYGYGGFDISLTPGFNAANVILLENGGIYAVANLRGGGEYGKEWHLAGTKHKKQNVFDDFQAAAEFLIKEKYTCTEKLAIMGGSNGGLLVGACMTQRPDLYQVAIPRVGVLDMLRYHQFTIGWAWAEDYGRSDDPEEFDYLVKYSPLHNIKETEFPATLVMTADHDDRVVPAHSFKFISELQKKHQGDNPVLIRIETSAGHGAGKPISKVIEENADMMSFIFYNLNEDVIYKNIDS